MWPKIFVYTNLLLFWSTCEGNRLTGFEEISKPLETKAESFLTPSSQIEPNELEVKKSAKRQIKLEDLRTEFKTTLNELRELIVENKRDLKLELDSLKTLMLTRNATLPALGVVDVDEHKSCEPLFSNTYNNCEFAMLNERNKDGLYLLHFAPLAAYCQRFESKGWTIIFRRHFANTTADSVHFRNWDSYKNGFGNLNGDHWLGLERLHQMTKDWVYELWLQLKFVNGTTLNLRNGYFKVGSEAEGYKLEQGAHIGYDVNDNDFGDILLSSYGMKFSTYDTDNDNNSEINCAKTLGFGWWYNKCNESGLMGKNLQIVRTDSNGKKQTEVKELEYIHMAIRLENI